MSNCYLIWREDETIEYSRKIKCDYASCAVERWAEIIDSSGAEYEIAHGESVTVFCQLNEVCAKPRKFIVSGEVVPQYYAREVE